MYNVCWFGIRVECDVGLNTSEPGLGLCVMSHYETFAALREGSEEPVELRLLLKAGPEMPPWDCAQYLIMQHPVMKQPLASGVSNQTGRS